MSDFDRYSLTIARWLTNVYDAHDPARIPTTPRDVTLGLEEISLEGHHLGANPTQDHVVRGACTVFSSLRQVVERGSQHAARVKLERYIAP